MLKNKYIGDNDEKDTTTVRREKEDYNLRAWWLQLICKNWKGGSLSGRDEFSETRCVKSS